MDSEDSPATSPLLPSQGHSGELLSQWGAGHRPSAPGNSVGLCHITRFSVSLKFSTFDEIDEMVQIRKIPVSVPDS